MASCIKFNFNLKDHGEIWFELAYMLDLCILGSSVQTGVTVAWNIVNG